MRHETYEEMIKRQTEAYDRYIGKHTDITNEEDEKLKIMAGIERAEAVEADTTGDGFIYEMFTYELKRQHYNGANPDTVDRMLDFTGLTRDDITASPSLLHGFKRAIVSFG